MNESASAASPRILVIRGGAIGDFILTLPVLTALGERFPGAAIEVLGYPRIATLALLGGLAKAVHAIESPGLAAFFSMIKVCMTYNNCIKIIKCYVCPIQSWECFSRCTGSWIYSTINQNLTICS